MTKPLTNQGFAVDLTGWTNNDPAQCTLTWLTGGYVEIDASLSSKGLYQSYGPVLIGEKLIVTYVVISITGEVSSYIGGGQNLYGAVRNSPGVYTDVFTMVSGGTPSISVLSRNGAALAVIDRIGAKSNMAGAFSINMIDRDDDSRQFTLPATTVSAANHDAQAALAAALVAGIEGISRLVTERWDFIASRTVTGDPRPTAGSAQVNIEWQVTYVEDTTLEVRTVRIGGANLDLTDVLLPGSNVADLTQTQMAAFVSAFEAYVLGPNGNAVTVQQVAFLE